MNLLDAVEKAEHNENVQKLKGYFLGSVFASVSDTADEVSEWTVLYYNPHTRSVVDCFVNENFVTVGEETPAIKEIEELRMDDVKIGAEDAMAIVEKLFKGKAINILISLHEKELDNAARTVWTIAFVTQAMSVTSYDIGASSGEIVKEETSSLIRKM